jgi:hypothetical protein
MLSTRMVGRSVGRDVVVGRRVASVGRVVLWVKVVE